jgi:hypothetical protein
MVRAVRGAMAQRRYQHYAWAQQNYAFSSSFRLDTTVLYAKCLGTVHSTVRLSPIPPISPILPIFLALSPLGGGLYGRTISFEISLELNLKRADIYINQK